MGNKKDFTLKIQIINLDTKSVPQFPLYCRYIKTAVQTCVCSSGRWPSRLYKMFVHVFNIKRNAHDKGYTGNINSRRSALERSKHTLNLRFVVERNSAHLRRQAFYTQTHFHTESFSHGSFCARAEFHCVYSISKTLGAFTHSTSKCAHPPPRPPPPPPSSSSPSPSSSSSPSPSS